ncbi:MAG TPA: ABC-2 family transporter protein [Clostridia bacterium]|nr:ABC-2 family transporter protein [Clostridia bacterium]
MGRYWTIFKISWQNSIEYRFDFVAHMVLGLISLMVTLFIFKAVFSQTDNFSGYTFSSMFTYLVMTKVLHFSTRGNTARYIASEIKEGKLSMYLIRPIGYLRYWLSLFLADRFFEIFVRFLLLIIFFLFFSQHLRLPSPGTIFVFILFLTISLALNYLINIFISSFAFWVTDIRLFSSALGLITGFLAGALVPLDILPLPIKKLSLFLPFQYAMYFPIKIYQNSLSLTEIFKGFGLAIGWIFVLVFFLKFFWLKGLKRYEAVGQ